MNTKPLAKSLHTVTVLQQIARAELASGRASDPVAAVQRALKVIFGADIPPDTYGLAMQAAQRLARAMGRAQVL